MHNKTLALTGVIVAVGTLFGVGVSIFQVCMVRESNRSASVQMDRLICAANKNAAAAKSFSDSAAHINDGVNSPVTQLQGQVTQMKLIQRPWVAFVENSITATMRSSGSSSAAHVTLIAPKGNLINIGQTPAEEVRVDFAIRYGAYYLFPKKCSAPKENENCPVFRFEGLTTTYKPLMIGSIIPGHTRPVTFWGDDREFPISFKHHGPAIQSANIEGTITYRTAWGSRGATKFCSMLEGPSPDSTHREETEYYCDKPSSTEMK